jgi:hypothetical protein
MFSDAAGTVPTLTTDLTDGFAATINTNLDGTASVTNFSPQTTTSTPTSLTPVPEPGSLTLLGVAVAGLSLVHIGNRAYRKKSRI